MKPTFATMLFLCLAFSFAQNGTNIYAQLPDNSEWVIKYSQLALDTNSVSFPNNNAIHIMPNEASMGDVIIPYMDFSNITSSDSVYLSFDYETLNLTFFDTYLIVNDVVYDIFFNIGTDSGSKYINITPYVANQNDVDLTFFFAVESGEFIEINNLQLSYFPPFSEGNIDENTGEDDGSVVVDFPFTNTIDIYTTGNGAENETVTLISGPIDLSNLENPVLSIDYLINDETNASQTTLLISTNGGITFEEIPIIQGSTSAGGNTFSVDLSAYAGATVVLGLQITGITDSFNALFYYTIRMGGNDGDIVLTDANPYPPRLPNPSAQFMYDCLPLNEPVQFHINYDILAAQCGTGYANQTVFETKVSIFDSNNTEIWTMTVPNNTYEVNGEKWQMIAGDNNCNCENANNDCSFIPCTAGIYTLKVEILDDSDCNNASYSNSVSYDGIELTKTLIAGCCEANMGNTITYNDFSAIPNLVYAENTIEIDASGTLSSSKVIIAGESITMINGEIAPNITDGQQGTYLNIGVCEENNEATKQAEEATLPEVVGDAEFKIYPNPTNAIANIVYDLKSDIKAGISIYNTLGQRVAQIEAYGEKAKGNYKISYDTSNLKAGIYYCTLESDNFVKSIKIVKIE